jgi:hypothetical protein
LVGAFDEFVKRGANLSITVTEPRAPIALVVVHFAQSFVITINLGSFLSVLISFIDPGDLLGARLQIFGDASA